MKPKDIPYWEDKLNRFNHWCASALRKRMNIIEYACSLKPESTKAGQCIPECPNGCCEYPNFAMNMCIVLGWSYADRFSRSEELLSKEYDEDVANEASSPDWMRLFVKKYPSKKVFIEAMKEPPSEVQRQNAMKTLCRMDGACT